MRGKHIGPFSQFLKIVFYTITFCIPLFCFSQKRQTSEFGKPSESEFALKFYDKDTTAAAVVLFEQGYYYYEAVGGKIKLVKEVYKKIKVFDSKQIDYGVIDIPLFTSEDDIEKVSGIAARTHNGKAVSIMDSDAAFLFSDREIGTVFRMVLPNVRDGSIIEFAYKIVSPFLFNFYGWEFQGEIPKTYSEFIFKIPLAFQFNNVLYGKQPLYINKSELIGDCLQTTYNTHIIRCPITLYAMVDIPAFNREMHMLSPKNYISRVEFEPKELRVATGWSNVKKFSTDWKDVDRLIRKGDYVGKQLNKSNYFKKRLPDSIFSISNKLEKAKAVYGFIQNHYTWNERYYSSETQIKDAFNLKKGSVPEINISLTNALQAAGLDAKLMLLSTRENGLPTDLYPVMTKFNYTITVLSIEDNIFLLDATNKQAPFGIIPFRALNVQGRVMDFKKGSYWMAIEPFKQNIIYANSQIGVDSIGNFSGKTKQTSQGYIALGKRNFIDNNTLQEYVKLQTNDKAGIEIENYQVEDLHTIEKPFIENYDISINPEIVEGKIILYPFFNKAYISENPFKMKERSYPMDFGFPFTNTYLVSIDLGNEYEIEQLPKSRAIKLQNDDAECSVTYVAEGSKINIRFNMKLNTYRFPPDAYSSLKEFFATVVTILKEEPVILKKI